MGGEGFTTDGEVLPTLATVFEEQARVVSDAIAAFRAAAVDGMAEAWGPAGADQRQPYLEGAALVQPQLEAVAAFLQSGAEKLRASASATTTNERGVADMFAALESGLGDGSR